MHDLRKSVIQPTYECTINEECLRPLSFHQKNLSNTVVLNESGFSEPVGIFNPVTRIAFLTCPMINKSLSIEINDITFNGNGFPITTSDSNEAVTVANGYKNILIKNLNINSVGTSLKISPQAENIIIENSILSGQSYGIVLTHCRNITIQNVEFNNQKGISLDTTVKVKIINNKFNTRVLGIYLVSTAQYTTIDTNEFSNCLKGIEFGKDNTQNSVICNKFLITKPIYSVNTINFYENNHFNSIVKNEMVLENINYSVSQDNLNFFIYFVSMLGKNNSFNKIIENKFKTAHNNLNLSSPNTILFRIYGVGIFFENANNEISKNEFNIVDNKVSLQGSSSESVVFESILMTEATSNTVSSNICTIIDNHVSFNNSTSSLIADNIYLGNNTDSSVIKENKCMYKENKIYNPNCKGTIHHVTNIFCLAECDSNVISGNNLSIEKNSHGKMTSILLDFKNSNNEISKNTMYNPQGDGIILNVENNTNVISANAIENIARFGIGLIKDNFGNIIKENMISGKEIGIYLEAGNTSNLINENRILNNYYGIKFPLEPGTNIHNIVTNNQLCHNGVILFGIDPVVNYISGNNICANNICPTKR